MKKTIILILSICVCCTACSSKSGIVYEVKQDSQIIEIGAESYSIPFVQIVNCTNKNVQNRANTLLSSIIYDITENSLQEWNGLTHLSVEVMCQTPEYLSLVYDVNYDEPGIIKYGSGHIGVTIDTADNQEIIYTIQ